MNVSCSYESVTICPSFWFPSLLYSATFRGSIVRLSSVSGEIKEFCLVFCQLILVPAIPHPLTSRPQLRSCLLDRTVSPRASLWHQVSNLLHLTVSWPDPHLFSPCPYCLTETLPCGQLSDWCWRLDTNWKTDLDNLTCPGGLVFKIRILVHMRQWIWWYTYMIIMTWMFPMLIIHSCLRRRVWLFLRLVTILCLYLCGIKEWHYNIGSN